MLWKRYFAHFGLHFKWEITLSLFSRPQCKDISLVIQNYIKNKSNKRQTWVGRFFPLCKWEYWKNRCWGTPVMTLVWRMLGFEIWIKFRKTLQVNSWVGCQVLVCTVSQELHPCLAALTDPQHPRAGRQEGRALKEGAKPPPERLGKLCRNSGNQVADGHKG